ncbi:hypothetical protein [Frigidibacter sp. MR17.24]|uniref:hypothetical protein n=1 Tax=Frigidibacter sp. MR17.24 TaxID=3127345 RepID=UPI003012CECB
MLQLAICLQTARPLPQLPPGPPVPVTPRPSVRADGWRADLYLAGAAVPGTWGTRQAFDPDSDAAALSVRRPGFDTAGLARSYDDLVRPLSEIRAPWNAAWDNGGDSWPLARSAATGGAVSPVGLSDFVYQGDLVEGGDNLSTRPYPKAAFVWLQPDHAETGNLPVLRAYVDHLHGRAGRPVAAARLIATDAQGAQVTAMAAFGKADYAVSGLSVPCLEWTPDLTALAEGPVTLDVILYPWRGPAQQLSVMGHPAPHLRRATMTVHKRLAARPLAYVSPAGSNATGVASTDPATAAASPFLTTGAAVAAINALAGHVSGGVVRLQPGVYVLGAGSAESGGYATPGGPLVYEAADPAQRATTVLTDNSATKSANNVPDRVVFRDLTLRRQSATAGSIIRHNTAVAASLCFERVAFDANGVAELNYWLRNTGRCWFIGCSQPNGRTGVAMTYASNAKNMVAFGCSGLTVSGNNALSTLLASRTDQIGTPASGQTLSMEGGAFAFNIVSGTSTTGFLMGIGTTDLGAPDSVFSVAGNVIERFGTATAQGAVRAYADGDATEVHGLLLTMNTSPALNEEGRVNWLYNDQAGISTPKDGARRFNIYSRSACKTDAFAQDPNAVGNWPAVFHVSSLGNLALDGGAASQAWLGPESWRRETDYPLSQWGGAGEAQMTAAGFVSDQSLTAGNAGGGDYRLVTGSQVMRLPAGMAPFGFDLLGRAIPDDGTGFVGALPAPA